MIYYYKGLMVEKVSEIPSDDSALIVRVLDTITPEIHGIRELYVKKDELKPVVVDKFKMGDHVKSKGSFTGIVVGFEPDENRVIIRPSKLARYSNDRTRYAYKADELDLYDPDFIELKPGMMLKKRAAGFYDVITWDGDYFLAYEGRIEHTVTGPNSSRKALSSAYNVVF